MNETLFHGAILALLWWASWDAQINSAWHLSCKFFVAKMFSERCIFIDTLKSSHFWTRSTNEEMHELMLQSTFGWRQDKLDLLLSTRDLGTELHLWSQKINHHHEGHDHISTTLREKRLQTSVDDAILRWHNGISYSAFISTLHSSQDHWIVF